MPEMRPGLLWSFESRTPATAAVEWERIKARFRERYGTEPVGAVIGEKVCDLLDTAHETGLLPEGKTLCIVARNIIDNANSAWWVHMHGGEEAKHD